MRTCDWRRFPYMSIHPTKTCAVSSEKNGNFLTNITLKSPIFATPLLPYFISGIRHGVEKGAVIWMKGFREQEAEWILRNKF
jgi:hypothetical protein